jgi:hypothetical protein
MLKGPPPEPPARGTGGDPCAKRTHARKVWSARVVCKPRAGGRGAPARGLQRAHCTPGGPPTQNSTWLPLAQRAAHAHGTARQAPPSQPGAALALHFASAVTGDLQARRRRVRAAHHVRRHRCSPARALRASIATRVTGGPKARSTARPLARRVRRPRPRQLRRLKR